MPTKVTRLNALMKQRYAYLDINPVQVTLSANSLNTFGLYINKVARKGDILVLGQI